MKDRQKFTGYRYETGSAEFQAEGAGLTSFSASMAPSLTLRRISSNSWPRRSHSAFSFSAYSLLLVSSRSCSEDCPTRCSASDTDFFKAATSASRPLSVARSDDISELNFDFRLSNSRIVILGTLRGVGAGGSSKSRRFRILPEPRGVARAD